uniref:Peptidase_M41 domain-containing protein n=1 Tax=Globodera pallida TaxID=36090 RepID=A0A183CLI2_GLOPA
MTRKQRRAQRLRRREEAAFEEQEALVLVGNPANNKGRVAHHEMGHSFMLWFQREAGEFVRTTVVVHGDDDGATTSDVSVHKTRGEMWALLCVQIGGRVAEELAFNGQNMGHGNDEAGDQYNWSRTARTAQLYFDVGGTKLEHDCSWACCQKRAPQGRIGDWKRLGVSGLMLLNSMF